MRTCAECMLCMVTRELRALDDCVPPEEKADYFRKVLNIVSQSDPEETTAQIGARVSDAHIEKFGQPLPFAAMKTQYNELLLSLEDALWKAVQEAKDPLERAMRLSQVGNYIDYGTIEDVNEAALRRLLDEAMNLKLDTEEYGLFKEDLTSAKTLCYITDNCGEVVLDKLLIRLMQESYPSLKISALVRGSDAYNDVTVKDAHDVGLDALVPVIGNGTRYPGTVISEITTEAREMLYSADMIIAKGQGNFETLCGCGLNIYYSFLCKCDYFVKRFKAKRFDAMFVNEKRILQRS